MLVHTFLINMILKETSVPLKQAKREKKGGLVYHSGCYTSTWQHIHVPAFFIFLAHQGCLAKHPMQGHQLEDKGHQCGCRYKEMMSSSLKELQMHIMHARLAQPAGEATAVIFHGHLY